MINPTKYPKLTLLLLTIASIVFITSDQIQFQSKKTTKHFIFEETDGDHIRNHGEEDLDHSDSEIQKRMGIYHYNEGNKFLKQNNWEEAIRNYKMALHHNKNFNDAYINLSTAYLNGKQLKASLKTLKILQRINSKHPLLHYNLACYYALTGNTTLGVKSLKQAVANGFKDLQTLKTDPDLKNLRSDPRFKELQKSLTAKNT
jgi:tetratricopeptide (TPR) repeat protein